MHCDNVLLDKVIREEISLPLLRTYGWNTPTISIGLNQKFNPSTNADLPFVKRITGGQAVIHSNPLDEITYSIFLRYEYRSKDLYLEIGNLLISFLEKLGLQGRFGYSKQDLNYFTSFNCFDSKTTADIVVDDIKVIGNAQRRKKKYILQHGSIRLDKIKLLTCKELTFEEAATSLKETFKKKLNVNFIDFFLANDDYRKISSYNDCVSVA